MSESVSRATVAFSSMEADVRALYQRLLDAWNAQDANAYAMLFGQKGHVVGFDGSVVNGRAAIGEHLRLIFADHVTAAYVGIVREVRFLGGDTALLRAVVGMVPPGAEDINPAANAIQSLVATRANGHWHVELFHNTPAQFHGRPELAEELTAALRAQLK